jgi:hypothetical protein
MGLASHGICIVKQRSTIKGFGGTSTEIADPVYVARLIYEEMRANGPLNRPNNDPNVLARQFLQ